MGDPVIDIREVSKVFDRVTALDRVTCTAGAGEVIGLIGPNGSGKTTLIRLLCAYFPPSRGSVWVAGYDTQAAPLEVRRRVGYALEGVVLYPDLTVRDFLSFVQVVKRANSEQFRAAVEQSGLEGWLRRRIGTLSKGYRQRVVLAQALLGDPPVLIFDEPTAGMDPEMAVKVRTLIKALAGARTILLSTHSLAEASLLCQRIWMLYHGRLLVEGAPQELFPGQEQGATIEDVFLRVVGARTAEREQNL